MKAITIKRAGSADMLVVSEIAKPVPGSFEIVVKVCASTVTRGDVVMRKMPRLVARAFGETPKAVLGHEFAGEVDSLGERVGRFHVGDRVFGTTTGLRHGSHAEYIVVPASGVVTRIPDDVSFEDAAASPVGAMTALHFLRRGRVRPGTRVLVNGASGSVGSFAVQIARSKGAIVTGVASTSKLELVASLGAHHVLDYTRDRLTESGLTFDLVFDAAGKLSAKGARKILSDTGVFVTTNSRRKEAVGELEEVKEMLGSGSLRLVVDRCYRLHEIPDAHRYVESGRKTGSVVVGMLCNERSGND